MARDLVHQKHSALLRLIFLHIQIVVHRRFLPVMLQEDVGESSALSASALAICTTAAQATIRVLETFELMGSKELPSTGFAFGAATILLLNMWDTQRKGPLNVDVSGHLEDVQRCIRILRGSERRCGSSFHNREIFCGSNGFQPAQMEECWETRVSRVARF